MVKDIIYLPKFSEAVRKTDGSYKNRIKNLIIKIVDNPQVGKPMQYDRKGTREVYLSPYRLSYSYNAQEDILYFIDLYHKDEQ
jgi:mRNA-degrading endonuclease RelE of RelBE toxin-antitoxin system